MKKYFLIYLVGVALCSPLAHAKIDRDQKVNGSLETGFWYLMNNVSSFEDEDAGTTYTAQDGYGNSYVQDTYMLFHARLKLDTGRDKDALRFHMKGRFLYNLQDQNYTLGIAEKYRYQFNELNAELNKKKTQIFVGRKTNYQAGGISVDGLTAIFKAKDDLDVGVYGGLGVDPRQFTGYIGPMYRNNPANLDFVAGGAFTSLRKNKIQFDFAVNALLYELSIDRINVFTHWMANLHEKWSFSGLLDVGAAGDTGLLQAQAMVHTKITSKVSNNLSYHRYRSVYFDASDASGVPVPSTINPNFDLGTSVNTTYYQRFANHTKFKLQKNYFFTNVAFSKRAFDDLKRKEFTIGYRDPNIKQSRLNITVKSTIIDNYKSYHALVDMMLGMDIVPQKVEFEIGGNVSYNERDVFSNFEAVQGSTVTEQESVIRSNLIFQPTLKMAWYLQYRMYNQVDVVNNDQKIRLHEMFISTNLRF